MFVSRQDAFCTSDDVAARWRSLMPLTRAPPRKQWPPGGTGGRKQGRNTQTSGAAVRCTSLLPRQAARLPRTRHNGTSPRRSRPHAHRAYLLNTATCRTNHRAPDTILLEYYIVPPVRLSTHPTAPSRHAAQLARPARRRRDVMSSLATAAQHAAALALWPAATRALGWPLALALTLLWLSAAERHARRKAVLEARRGWEVRRFAVASRRPCASRAKQDAQAPRDGGDGESLEWLTALLAWCETPASPLRAPALTPPLTHTRTARGRAAWRRCCAGWRCTA